ncbi:hypothetical protein DM15PD_09310 [Aristophania vespae]|nr:hypothetical protein DM15PD_09310 [Aristophania vespae]
MAHFTPLLRWRLLNDKTDFLKITLLVLISSFCVNFAFAQSCEQKNAEFELGCHSWTEITQALKEGSTTVIVPIGGTEQSGPYIAVDKHNRRVHYLAGEIARNLGGTFVAPVIAYVPEGSTNPRQSHMRFAGTLSIPPHVFAGLLEGIAESLKVQGFKAIVLLGDHGGYQKQLAQIAQSLNRKWQKEGAQARLLYVKNYYDVIPHSYAQLLAKKGLKPFLGQHADLSDTSLTLAVDPSLVRLKALKQAPKPGIADGVYGGDPRPASAEIGRWGIEMQLNEAVKAIRLFNRSHL